ncbi:MAG TPA: tripartite tricarboxylate transporter substrate binding protein [Burkholderiaceae bacterium]|nr:tripartite tricarboxylate transporter substrate binding protein [Burkholderiaceae bacterium]
MMSMQSSLYLRRLRNAALTAALALGLPAWAWPDKIVKIVTPAPPGGSTDVLARLIADAISAESGQTVIVENKPGAAGSIAVRAMLTGAPDGHTLLVAPNNLVSEAPLAIKPTFDPFNDVRPISAVANSCLVLVGNAELPKNLKGLVEYAKGQRGKMSYASFSAGTASHYAGLVLNAKEDLDMQHIPFPGAPPALAQVMGGQIPLMFDSLISSKPYIQSGKLVAYGYASKTRSPFMPQLPTLAEQGYPDINFCNWTGVYGAGKLPTEMVDTIHAALTKAAATPKFRERLATVGFEPAAEQSPAQLSQGLRADYERNAGILKSAGIKLSE